MLASILSQKVQAEESSALRVQLLADLQENDQAYFGAKAVHLGKLIQMGFRVPSGFVLSLSMECHELSSEAKQVILDHCDRLSSDPHQLFAVRSSAFDEDSPEFSFAGLYDSFLNVPGGEPLVDAILRCLGSARSERILRYRKEFGLESRSMGVIVQKMALAQFSGVCFTQSSQNADHLAIELIPGLGDSLVSGRATPAQLVLERKSLQVLKQVGPTQYLSGLSWNEIQEIARGALRAEEILGYALDLEWARDRDGVTFLQARPLTHQKAQDAKARLLENEKTRLKALAHQPQSIWTDFSIGDVLTYPCPLTVDGFSRISQPGSGVAEAFRSLGISYQVSPGAPPIYDSICGRSYIHLTEYLKRVSGGLPLTVVLKAPHQVSMKFDFQTGVKAVLGLPLQGILRSLVFISKFFSKRKVFHVEFRSVNQKLKKEAEKERKKSLLTLTDRELWKLYSQYTVRTQKELNYYHMLTDIISMLTQGLLKLGLQFVYGKEAEERELALTTGLEGNFNTETNLALSRVVDGSIPLEEFLNQYGHRGSPDWDVSAARWREDPSPVYRMLTQLKSCRVRGEEEFNQQKKTRLESVQRLKKDLEQKWVTRVLKSFVLRELSYYQLYSPLREETQSTCFLWVELTRRVLLEMAKRAHADDLLFYLSQDELKQFFSSPEKRSGLLAQARQKKRDLQLLRTCYVPHILSSDDIDQIGNPPEPDPSISSLHGQSIFRGYVSGTARVMKNLEEAQDLKPGEILVTQFTDPSWTPLFFIAGGIILEQGSSYSHGALVAREIGLPGLVNVPHATQYIQDGQKIILDADHGRVFLTQ